MLEKLSTTASASAVSPSGRTFIRVTEVWTIDPADERLKLASGIYGTLDAFKAVSGKESFAFGEGLPGKAWAEARPVVLTGFHGTYFKRTEAADAAGLTAGIAVPVLNGGRLMGVVTFLFGDDAEHVGAVEVWHGGPGADALRLEDGYFGTADHFAWISRHTRFPKGQGLPGMVWKTGGAVLFRDLGASHRFIRSESAVDAGITTGLGLPVPSNVGGVRLVTLLSALGTPIARRFEIWRRGDDGSFACADGADETGAPLTAAQIPARLMPGQGLIGQVAASGVPVASDEGKAAVVALPIHRDGQVAEIAAWYF